MTKRQRIQKILSNSWLHIFFLFLLALSFRLYQPRIEEVFMRNDEVLLFQYSLKPLSIFYTSTLENSAAQLFRFFNFPWGPGTIFLSTVNSAFMSILGLSLTEFTITLPYLIIGSWTVILVYLIGKEIKGKLFGFVAAILLAFLPAHIIMSRTITGNAVAGQFFSLLALLLFIKYLKTKKSAYKIIGVGVVAYHLITENQAIAIIPIILFTSFLYTQEKKNLSRIKESIKQIFSWEGFLFAFLVILPTLLSWGYLFLKGLGNQSYLNLTHSKIIIPGIYPYDVLKSIYFSAGPALFFLLLLGFFYYLFMVMLGNIKKESFIFLFSFVVYSVPWFFLIPPYNHPLNGYHLSMIMTLLFMAAYFVEDIIRYGKTLERRCVKFIYTTAIIITFLFISIHTAFVVFSEINMDERFFAISSLTSGTFGKNNGIKTMGYYLREYHNSDAVIFTDTGLFVAQYYFGREDIIAGLYLSPQESLQLFSEKLKTQQIDYVFISEENKLIFAVTLHNNDFFPVVYAVQDGKIKGILYAKGKSETDSSQVLDIETYDKLFNKKYGNIQGLFIDYE